MQQSYILSDAVVVAGLENSPFVPLNKRNKQRETAKRLTLHEVAVIPTIMAKLFGKIQPFIFQLIFYHFLQPPPPLYVQIIKEFVKNYRLVKLVLLYNNLVYMRVTVIR